MKVRLYFLLALALTVLWLGWWTWRKADEPIPAENNPRTALATPKESSPSTAPKSRTPPADARAALAEARAALQKLPAGQVAAFLEQLRSDLEALPPAQTVAAIREFLDSRQDYPTNLPFGIGADGRIESAPTLRAWLMDELARIDLNEAARMAEKVLASRDNAAEWAIALRDYARTHRSPADTAFLQAKLRELWQEPSWRQEQSPAWLHAFDLAPHLRSPDLAPDLAALIVESKGPAKPTQHAAFQALDGLIATEPAGVLDHLQKNPELLKGHELMRGELFARADPRDPRQRAILEAYLASSPDYFEFERFASTFPRVGSANERRLLTAATPPTAQEIAALNREALQAVEAWQTDPRFENLRPILQNLHTRLSTTPR